jgi:hypothetical protein
MFLHAPGPRGFVGLLQIWATPTLSYPWLAGTRLCPADGRQPRKTRSLKQEWSGDGTLFEPFAGSRDSLLTLLRQTDIGFSLPTPAAGVMKTHSRSGPQPICSASSTISPPGRGPSRADSCLFVALHRANELRGAGSQASDDGVDAVDCAPAMIVRPDGSLRNDAHRAFP